MTTDKTFQLVQTWGPLGEGSKIETVYGDIDHNGPYSLVLGIIQLFAHSLWTSSTPSVILPV